VTAARWARRLARLPLLLLVLVLAAPCALLALAGLPIPAMRFWCAAAAGAAGLRIRRAGAPPPGGCLVVSNHVGYLDILALGATVPGQFLAMAEIARWPLLGSLTRASGAIFVDRGRPRSAVPFLVEIARRFAAGRRVLLFPEGGVSPDGRTLRPFRPMLFQACADSGTPVVPVALRYTRPRDPAVWAWIDEPGLWRHLWTRVLPAERVEVEVRIGTPLRPRPGEGRKELAAAARRRVADLLGGEPGGQTPPGEGTHPGRGAANRQEWGS
jgi:1-acyl-sn-glycerol-3-phosphate acyltransferase